MDFDIQRFNVEIGESNEPDSPIQTYTTQTYTTISVWTCAICGATEQVESVCSKCGNAQGATITYKKGLMSGEEKYKLSLLKINEKGYAKASEKLLNPVDVQIKDSVGSNTGITTSFDGSGNLIIKLPSTIVASLVGNASTASSLQSSVNIQIKDSVESNVGLATAFDGSSDIVVKLPSTIEATLSGNATTATTLQTARDLKVNLASSESSSFDGSANVTSIGVAGTLPVEKGGTGQTTLALARNAMGLGNTTGAVPVANGGTGVTTIADTQAGKDGSGNIITSTYAPLASPVLTGTPTAPTAAISVNNTQIATTAFVHATIPYLCPYAQCTTDVATAAKAVTISNVPFVLTAGARVTVRFNSTNTAANPTLNVNNTGAKAIQFRGYNVSADSLYAGSTYDLVYTGSVWEVVGTMMWVVE